MSSSGPIVVFFNENNQFYTSTDVAVPMVPGHYEYKECYGCQAPEKMKEFPKWICQWYLRDSGHVACHMTQASSKERPTRKAKQLPELVGTCPAHHPRCKAEHFDADGSLLYQDQKELRFFPVRLQYHYLDEFFKGIGEKDKHWLEKVDQQPHFYDKYDFLKTCRSQLVYYKKQYTERSEILCHDTEKDMPREMYLQIDLKDNKQGLGHDSGPKEHFEDNWRDYANSLKKYLKQQLSPMEGVEEHLNDAEKDRILEVLASDSMQDKQVQ